MGFVDAPDLAPEVLTVETAVGRTATHAKARLYVLADRSAVLITPGLEPGTVTRTVYPEILGSTYDRSASLMTVTTADGEMIVMHTAGCNCGMGVVGSAGPVDGEYRLNKVRAPEWHSAP